MKHAQTSIEHDQLIEAVADGIYNWLRRQDNRLSHLFVLIRQHINEELSETMDIDKAVERRLSFEEFVFGIMDAEAWLDEPDPHDFHGVFASALDQALNRIEAEAAN